MDVLELITPLCLPNFSSAWEDAQVSAWKYRNVLSKGFGARTSLCLPVHLTVLTRFLKPSGVLKCPGCEDLVLQVRAGKIKTGFPGLNTVKIIEFRKRGN